FHQRKQPLGPLLCKDLVYVPALQSHPACRRESLFKTAGHIPSSLRSEEHTSELQSRENLVCRLLLEKKNNAGLPYRARRDRPHDPIHSALPLDATLRPDLPPGAGAPAPEIGQGELTAEQRVQTRLQG